MLLGETLPHSLPWYFGLTVFIIWLTAMVALALLIRRRLRAKAGTRRARRPPSPSAGPQGRHPLGPGQDVEVW